MPIPPLLSDVDVLAFLINVSSEVFDNVIKLCTNDTQS